MSGTPITEGVAAFVAVWKTAFLRVLEPLGVAGAKVEEADGTPLEPQGEGQIGILTVKFSGGGCLKGEMLWTCEKTVALQCAQLLMSEEINPEAEFTATHTDGFLEFIRQVAGEAAVGWKQQRGEPTEIVYQAETGSKFETQSTAAFRLSSEKCKALTFRVDLDASLAESVQPKPEAATTAPGADSSEVPAAALSGLPSNLDLILDVQLDATIRFGEREMLLQDVFGLMPGSVVELNQLVSEPAELLVAGRLVAKGEVVVVEGNFGLRVTEVVSSNQRAAVMDVA